MRHKCENFGFNVKFFKSQMRRCSVGIRCGMKPTKKWPLQAQLKALQSITTKSFPQFRDQNDSIRFQELQNNMTKIYRISFSSTSGLLPVSIIERKTEKSTTTIMNPSCSKNLSLDPHLMASFQKLAASENSKKSWF